MEKTPRPAGIAFLRDYYWVEIIQYMPHANSYALIYNGQLFQMSAETLENQVVGNFPIIEKDELLSRPEIRMYPGNAHDFIFSFKNTDKLNENNFFLYKGQLYLVNTIAGPKKVPVTHWLVHCRRVK